MNALSRSDLLEAQDQFLRTVSTDAAERFLPTWKSLSLRLSVEMEGETLSPELAILGLHIAKRIDSVAAGSAALAAAANQEIAAVCTEARDYLVKAGSSAFDLTSLAASLPPIAPPTKSAKKGQQKKSLPAPSPSTDSPVKSSAVYRNFFLAHFDFPYPTATELADLQSQVPGASLKSVQNWFVNYRRRSGWNDMAKRYGASRQTLRKSEGTSKHDIGDLLERIAEAEGEGMKAERKAVDRVRAYFVETGRDVLTGRVERIVEELRIQKAAGIVPKKAPVAPKPIRFVHIQPIPTRVSVRQAPLPVEPIYTPSVYAPPPVATNVYAPPPPAAHRPVARQYPRPMFQQERELSSASMESYEDDGGQHFEGPASPNRSYDATTQFHRHQPALYDAPRRPIDHRTPERQLSPPELSPPFVYDDSPEPLPLHTYATPQFSFHQPPVSPQDAQRSFSNTSSSNSIISYKSQNADDFAYLSKKKYSQPQFVVDPDPRNLILNSTDSSAVANWTFVDPEANGVAMGYNSSPSASYQSSPSPSYVDRLATPEQPSAFAQQWINSSQDSPTRAVPAGPAPFLVRSHSMPPPQRYIQFDNTKRYYSPPLHSTDAQYPLPPYVANVDSGPQFDLAPAPMFHPTYTQHVSPSNQEAYLYEQKQRTLHAAEEASYRLQPYQALPSHPLDAQRTLPPSPPRTYLPHQAPSRNDYPNRQVAQESPVVHSTHPITHQQFFTPLPSMKACTDYAPPSVGSSLLNPPSNSQPQQYALSPNSAAQEFGLGLTSTGPLGGRPGLGGGIGPRTPTQSMGNDFYMTMADHPFGNGLRISQPEARIGAGSVFGGAEGDWY